MGNGVRVGVAYASYVPHLLQSDPSVVDFVELPFELIRHDPAVLSVLSARPAILHCASLSIAGFVGPSPATLAEVRDCVNRTFTPWLGEHLAYLLAEAAPPISEHKDSMPLNVGYTVCPAFNRATLDRVKQAIRDIRKWCPVPLILENPPTYFVTPGTDMTQPEFFQALIDDVDCGLLLDLTHFAITCENLGVDAAAWLGAFPLENVVELHLSGMAQQSGITWDNHALPCSDEVWQLFTQALRRCTPQAVTIEYNWSPNFPLNVIEQDLRQVRRLLKEAA